MSRRVCRLHKHVPTLKQLGVEEMWHFETRYPKATPNQALELTAQSSLALLAGLWVPSLRSAAAQRRCWASVG